MHALACVSYASDKINFKIREAKKNSDKMIFGSDNRGFG